MVLTDGKSTKPGRTEEAVRNIKNDIRGNMSKHWKTSFEKKLFFSPLTSKLSMGLINNDSYGMLFACGVRCVADVLSVSPSSEQTKLIDRPGWCSPEKDCCWL